MSNKHKIGLLKIKKYPSFILRKKCTPVKIITDFEKNLFDNMLFTMRLTNGIGLAAPQIGLVKQLIVIDIGQGPIKLANPEILEVTGKDSLKEGCLSVPDAQVAVERATKIKVRGLNEEGKIIEISAAGLLARVFQHEIDHLNGRLIIDYLNRWEQIKYKISHFLPSKKTNIAKSNY